MSSRPCAGAGRMLIRIRIIEERTDDLATVITMRGEVQRGLEVVEFAVGVL
jgi:hypothetical protein